MEPESPRDSLTQDSQDALPVPPQDLWSSILDSVSSSRSIPSKNVLILGQPGSGKSTICEALLGRTKVNSNNDNEELKGDFAMGYEWADIRDDADEDTLARLSVYTVPSSHPSFTLLIPSFLPPRTSLGHTTVIVVLDWTKPWTFVEEMEEWFAWIERWAAGGLNNLVTPAEVKVKDAKDPKKEGRELEMIREENRERWQYYLQHYTEPSSDFSNVVPSASSAALSSNTVLPLGPGTLTHNSAGVPIIVVCTKADLIDEREEGAPTGLGGGMVKGKGGEWEERTDGIMQILRTICLKYGAALFYTTPLPETLSVLRQYTLHTLFVPSAPSITSSISSTNGAITLGETQNITISATNTSATTTNSSATATRNPFPFPHRPNTLDRDRISIPSGWDSWGKITILREFEPGVWGEGWEVDLESEGEEDRNGAKKMYRDLVPDLGTKPPALPPFNSPIPEQSFLARNYDESTKKADRDPRGAFKNPVENDGGPNPTSGTGAGIVGPMGTNSFNLPHVERLFMEMEGSPSDRSDRLSSSLSDRPDRTDRLNLSSSLNDRSSSGHDRRTRPTTNRPTMLTSTGASPPSGTGKTTSSPTPSNSSPSGISPTGGAQGASGSGQSQHEVLQNFFQSLLSNKDKKERERGPGSPSTGRPKSVMSNGSAKDKVERDKPDRDEESP